MSLVQIQSVDGLALTGRTAPRASGSGPKYWRSLDHLADTPEFHQWVEKEFPSSAAEMLDGNSRRTMLKVMAASFGLAGLAACSRPEFHLAPSARGREDYVPGTPYYFTSAFVLNGHAAGLTVQTYDGRPVKIEGNPDHPSSMGAATAFAQASVLSLYDPDRSSKVLQGGKDSDWEKFEAAWSALSLGDGSGLRFLSEPVISPTLESLRADVLKKYPKAKWIEFESIARDNERAGAVMAFGQALNVLPQYDKAGVVLSLDCDFLGIDHPTPLATKLFSQRRRVNSEEDLDKISRLYIAESQFSLTGANAEHRLKMKGAEVRQFALDVLAAVGGAAVAGNDKRAKFINAVAKDLKAAGAAGLVVAGPRQPASVHALAHAINGAIGAATVLYTKASTAESGVDALKALVAEMNGGQASTVVILGGNPAYAAPADLQFSAALSKVASSVHLGADPDETAASSKWHLPMAHYLESWGDVRSADGTVAVQQPMIQPLFGGRSAIEVLAIIAGSTDRKGLDLVRNSWKAQFASRKDASAENIWRKTLNDGIVPVARAEQVKAVVDPVKVRAAVSTSPAATTNGIEVAFVPSASAWDGTFANNGWMQEIADPITKLVWGNAALISKATAEAKGFKDGEIVTISKGGLKMDAALMIQPGQADNTIVISLGYGRPKVGRVGTDVGFNAGLIRTSSDFFYGDGFALAGTGKIFQHASMQEHGSMQEPELLKGVKGYTRPVYREATVDEYKKEPKVIEERQEVPPLHSIYTELQYTSGYQWGMAIDLGSCTGCSACVVACQAENNIPVVGKDQVLRGREMHWIRVDRYYVGEESDPRAVGQPVPCMQCENAPCENVCPVAATTHSPEGLNDMAYNRCVGTRYCANNCPFKVRHFNFLNWHKNEPELMAMVQNPDVTVRMRGIMEKCTYCVQRIQEARITAKTDNRRDIKEGEVMTACQQTCPADAIAFGNILDPNSRVAKLKKQERNYAMLAELDVKPRTTYLGRLRNPNPELEA